MTQNRRNFGKYPENIQLDKALLSKLTRLYQPIVTWRVSQAVIPNLGKGPHLSGEMKAFPASSEVLWVKNVEGENGEDRLL